MHIYKDYLHHIFQETCTQWELVSSRHLYAVPLIPVIMKYHSNDTYNGTESL